MRGIWGLLCLVAIGAVAEPLLQSTRSWDGGAISYPDGEAEITSVILRIEEGQEPPFHCHPVPTMGYVLRGVARLETQDGKTVTVREGQSVVEVMKTVHRGTAIEGPVEIVVFYAGARGLPVTVMPADEAAQHHCKTEASLH